MDKYLGKRLDGRYEIHELIGVGGMANVYRCTDTVDDREVAVKILKDEYLNNEEFIRRFKNESKAILPLFANEHRPCKHCLFIRVAVSAAFRYPNYWSCWSSSVFWC